MSLILNAPLLVLSSTLVCSLFISCVLSFHRLLIRPRSRFSSISLRLHFSTRCFSTFFLAQCLFEPLGGSWIFNKLPQAPWFCLVTCFCSPLPSILRYLSRGPESLQINQRLRSLLFRAIPPKRGGRERKRGRGKMNAWRSPKVKMVDMLQPIKT